MHDNNAIYNKALKILTKYFGVDEEDTTIAPATDGQTFAFGQGLPPGG
jgi:importin subunit alpha-6/7